MRRVILTCILLTYVGGCAELTVTTKPYSYGTGPSHPLYPLAVEASRPINPCLLVLKPETYSASVVVTESYEKGKHNKEVVQRRTCGAGE